MNPWFRITPFVLYWFLLGVSLPIPSLGQGSPVRQGDGSKMPLPSIAFGWLDDKSAFQAGDIATIKIKIFDDSYRDKISGSSSELMNFSLTVNGKKGNSSYISGVYQYLEGDPIFWNISFTAIRVGQFPVVITDDHFGIIDSSLHFTVTAGHIYPPACMISRVDFISEFVAGNEVYLLLLLKDAFGNHISSGISEQSVDYFKVSLSYENGSTADLPTVKHNGWNELGYFGVEFVPTIAGSLLFHFYVNNQTLSDSPLPFIVKPGSINITNSQGGWKYRTNMFQVFSKLEMFIYQKDQFGNLVPGFHPFDARVVEKTTNLSIPVADLLFEEVADGTQLLTFVVSKPGEFRLVIYDAKLTENIWKLTYDFSVYIGYCHESNIFANGSGLASAVAGRMSSFTVHLEDLYHNPSPVEEGRLRVEILSENSTSNVLPVIFPLQNLNEDSNVIQMSDGSTMWVPALPANENPTIIGNSTAQTSDFNVTYTPEKSEDYKIWVFCGNIPANDGNPYMMKVSPGLVDSSVSTILRFAPSVKSHIKNEVLVQLLDSYRNPISSQQSKLSFQVLSVNNSSLIKWPFQDNENGSYTGQYMAKDVGAYNICILFEDRHLSPCPLEVHVYEREYFSEVNNDSIFVWEDESLAFDVLSNDYIAGGESSIIEFSIPLHGSLLQYGKLFRYTPYQGFFGNDSFSYTISDVNKNIATAMVFISVLCKPPQFVSLPAGLHAIEDIVSPIIGGFPGFEIVYSDDKKNISLAMRAQSGNAYFSPIPMQLQQTQESFYSVSRGSRGRKELVISGHVETINSALQFVQYLGNENFYGQDIITLHAMNENGIQEAHVSVFVEPVNDPPIINAPKFISLTRKEGKNGMQIFDKQRDVFEFSIMDPDMFKFSGNKSHFVVMFSVEVNDGTLSTTLPADLINVAEQKIWGSNRWQPLQTFVMISNHFVLKGKGIRFRGTIGQCNNAIQHLYYQGTGNDAVLTITVNDMGNYGCSADCLEMISVPLYNEVTVSLVKRRPVNRMEILLLGSAILMEIIMMLLLGGMFLFFICRCINALHRERRDSSIGTAFSHEENIYNQ
ncbi:protein GAMETE EXPRESSED 2 isoform X1 [Canna indica]|uniref:Protein GAMETE EXPRESSED 2 isoform X1 n=1 Tax=Canna indica TaxID=4628 RepID=A0AAQ3KSN1_9LILI|nr:protein GAMETE EXPRESSED 2 isoform X1 [Canna indica]